MHPCHSPVQCGLTGAIRAEDLWKASKTCLGAHATDDRGDGKEDGVAGLAGLEKRFDGLEEEDGADGIDGEVVAECVSRGVDDGCARVRDSGVGNHDVEGRDAVLGFELSDSVLRVCFGR